MILLFVFVAVVVVIAGVAFLSLRRLRRSLAETGGGPPVDWGTRGVLLRSAWP
jgi:hypothetical protein